MGGRPMAGRERRCRRNPLRCCAGRVLLVRAASRRDGPGGAPPTDFAALGGSWAARGYRGTCELSLSAHGRTRITASDMPGLPDEQANNRDGSIAVSYTHLTLPTNREV